MGFTSDPAGVALGERVQRLVRLPGAESHIRRLARSCDAGAVCIDIGCGDRSPARRFAPGMRLIGIDSEPAVIAAAREHHTHDEYLVADAASLVEDLSRLIGTGSVQLVLLLHVVEHLVKPRGFQLLDVAERLSDRFVFVETPNRFLPQGPEWGNEAQRHRSGWFWQDFVGLGYTVGGTGGTRFLRGYAGAPKLPWRGAYSIDALLARMLWIERNPGVAWALAAWKDVRGVPARLGDRPNCHR